jgi:protein involved in polysaccharide export with SLBB domain
LRRARISLLAAIFLCAGAAHAQQPETKDERGRAEQPYGGASAQKGKHQDTWRGGDLAADNLDRVAATAEQISEVLNRDPGLMVELKRMLAQDAGASGQLLEESDLSDAAIAERLREELRTRVLATRLLQRYGYLLPKLNPDSDLAQEQKLFLQERAQQLVRAGERNYEPGDSSAERTAACRSNEQSDCEWPDGAAHQIRGRQNERGTNKLPAGQEPQDDENAPSARPENSNSPSLQRTEATEQGSGEIMQASTSQMGAGGNSSPNRGATRGSAEGSFPAMLGANDDPWGRSNVGERAGSAGVVPASSRDFDHHNSGREVTEVSFADLEPVRMVHRASPYAEAPSLYDLYVQAAAPTQQTTRFGMEVFRHRSVNADALPMDLPVGADYVLGPGDSLSIELWGGVSQRLFRTVDREGRLLLPEAGPLLVSGKSLGEVQDAVQRLLRTEFRNVSADVSLLKLRTVRVYVVGEVASPGAYDVSSLSTPLNALFAGGGITARGSLRRLEHYRGQQLLEEVDAYDLLLHGVRRGVQRL